MQQTSSLKITVKPTSVIICYIMIIMYLNTMHWYTVRTCKLYMQICDIVCKIQLLSKVKWKYMLRVHIKDLLRESWVLMLLKLKKIE